MQVYLFGILIVCRNDSSLLLSHSLRKKLANLRAFFSRKRGWGAAFRTYTACLARTRCTHPTREESLWRKNRNDYDAHRGGGEGRRPKLGSRARRQPGRGHRYRSAAFALCLCGWTHEGGRSPCVSLHHCVWLTASRRMVFGDRASPMAIYPQGYRQTDQGGAAASFPDKAIIGPDPRACMQRGSQCSAHIVFGR